MTRSMSLTAVAAAAATVSRALVSPVAQAAPAPTPTPTLAPVAGYGPVSMSAPTTTYVTPEQYGAKGDGKTDDAAAMQKALKAAEGKILWLPASKTYNISRTLSVPSNVTVLGAGESSVVRFTWTGVSSAGSGGGSNLRSAGTTASNIHLANFVLQGGGTGLPGGLKAGNPEGLVPLLKLIKVDQFSVTNMELLNAEGLTISYTGSTNGVFQHNYVHNSGRDGITGYRNTERNVTDILVDSNLIEKVGDDAIAINGLVPGHNLKALSDGSSPLPTRITITNNVIRGWESQPAGGDQVLGRGIALNGVAGALVQNNNLSHPNSTGILLTGCNTHICQGSSTDWSSEGAQLLNNVIAYSTGGSRPGAIAVIKTKNSVIKGNRASNSSPYDFAGATYSTISDNTQTSIR